MKFWSREWRGWGRGECGKCECRERLNVGGAGSGEFGRGEDSAGYGSRKMWCENGVGGGDD